MMLLLSSQALEAIASARAAEDASPRRIDSRILERKQLDHVSSERHN